MSAKVLALAAALCWVREETACAEGTRFAAGPGGATATAGRRSACREALQDLGVSPTPRSLGWIADAVQIPSTLGGVRYVYGSRHAPLIIDCSLALSLAEAGRYFAQAGIDTVYVASAYARRYVRGTRRWSKHAYGLALDVYAVGGPEIGTIDVAGSYEQGLSRGYDCLGEPLDDASKHLKLIFCQLTYSELFYLVLSPDYDTDHEDHFHLEALPWDKRPSVRSGRAAIH